MPACQRQANANVRAQRYNNFMCANYRPSTREILQHHFQVAPPDSAYSVETYPGNMAPLIRPPHADSVVGDRACALGMFGLVPSWAKNTTIARHTYNARTETVAEKPSFRNAWRRRQFCIIPVMSFFEPSYESGKPVRWEIAGATGEPLGLAGIWEFKKERPNDLPLLSFSMLTINADDHPLMKRFHKPGDEKRMVVILPPDQYDDWLHCPVEEASSFLTQFPAERLVAHAAPKPSRTTVQKTLSGVSRDD
jgi:putative SOS response-associated peptidase YedK